MHNKAGRLILNARFRLKFTSGMDYWEKRYKENGTSGTGSYGELAAYKSSVLNRFVKENGISSVIEFGCGDGNQLQQFDFPVYIGLDVSVTALQKCIKIFKDDHTKSFFIYNCGGYVDNTSVFKAELALSLDVIYHLLDDSIYEKYMTDLFSAATKYVIIYAWNLEGQQFSHVRYRKFTTWIKEKAKQWQLHQVIENPILQPACDFYIYKKK